MTMSIDDAYAVLRAEFSPAFTVTRPDGQERLVVLCRGCGRTASVEPILLSDDLEFDIAPLQAFARDHACQRSGT